MLSTGVSNTGHDLAVRGDRPDRRAEAVRFIRATAAELFDYLDDHSRLSAHMARRSWRMGWGSMSIELDEARGRAVGSRITLSGTMLGIPLSVESRVVVHDSPLRKTWATVGEPRLLVVGPYEMGFAIAPEAGGCRLNVFIRYCAPAARAARLLASVFGPAYARWCTRMMANDAQRHFERPSAALDPGLMSKA
jgi:hypothetical protein